MTLWRNLAAAAALSVLMAAGAAAQTKPEGEIKYAVYVTLSPAWLDPGEAVPGTLTPFWIMYALHDALVKPAPGKVMAPALAESWTVSPDQRVYEFTLRQGVKFHNGDPFTADDVKYSFERAKAAELRGKVQEVVVVDPLHVRFVLKQPWPDFMTYYGTLASAAGWIVPKNYTEKVGKEGFKAHPVGLGPYKFVSNKPGLELILEAYDGYWGEKPSVKRLVFESVPEETTRLAMLKRGDVDVAYLLDASLAQAVKDDPKLKLAFSGGIGTYYLDFFDMWDPKSPWHDARVRKAASLAIDRHALSDAETLGASPPTGSVVLKSFEYAMPIEPDPYDPAQAKKLLAEAGYPNGFDAGDLYPWPPYFSAGEAIAGYLGAIGIKTRVRTMERAAFYAALPSKKLKGLCMCIAASPGNASTRLAQLAPSDGGFAYGGFPDVDQLWKQQLAETDHAKREALLHQIQKILHDRTRVAPIYDYFWASGIGPRVADPAFMKIDPYPWSAPYQLVKLK
ncbi:MAG TPA: ABC transporter substrate-binding protein, partial [Stellaceae bacterium]|nr:ABC transporter substrate-binding protein [Stellaceae bacterium]